jgi:hypothetical protein
MNKDLKCSGLYFQDHISESDSPQRNPVKLVTGMTADNLAKVFGEFIYQCVSQMYCMIIGMVESKVDGILHGPNSMGHWVASLLEFARMIE